MRAIVYCRASSDQTGEFRSVESQEAECRAVCERNGWKVADVLVDNDRGASRYSTKDRPDYKKLAKILKPGDVLVTWEASRAQRDLTADVTLRDLCAERGVFWSYSGKLHDLTQGDARFSTGLDALLAEREAEQIPERVLRGKRAAAVEGRPADVHPTATADSSTLSPGKTVNWVIDPVTCPTVKDDIRRTLAGESLWSTADLERGVPGSPGPEERGEGAGGRSACGDDLLAVLRRSPDPPGNRDRRGVVGGDDLARRARASRGDPQ